MEEGTAALPRRQSYPRAARKSEWLRSTLAHHHCPEPGVENEVIVLATGIDQYIQEVFHHLAYPNQDDVVSAEDFAVLCAVLGLTGEGERREGEDEFQNICSGLPCELSFKDFHSRLCGYFRVRTARNGPAESTLRLAVTDETEFVEREIQLRWPRVRRKKCVSFDLSRDHNRPVPKTLKSQTIAEDHETAPEEAAALRELVEDLRSALQGSDARCLALEVALRQERSRRALTHSNPSSSGLTSSSKTMSNSLMLEKLATANRMKASLKSQGQRGGLGGDGAKRAAQKLDASDPILRELKLIRASRDGQLQEAIRFSQRLEEELCWAYQEVRRLKGVESALWKENVKIRRRAEEAREALKQGMQSVQLIQEQAQTVPQLQTRVTQLELELHQHRSRCSCLSDHILQPFYPMGADDTCARSDTECLQRAVEGRAASDEEEEESGGRREEEQGKGERRREEGQCCLVEVKKLINRLHDCGKGFENPAVHLHNQNLMGASKDARGNDRKRQAQPAQRPEEEEEGSRLEAQLEETDRARLSQLEEKLTDALTLLLQLRNKNVSRRALGKILMDTLDMCSRSGHGPSQVLQVADALCVQLSSSELLRDREGDGGGGREGGGERGETHPARSSGHPSTSANPLIISC